MKPETSSETEQRTDPFVAHWLLRHEARLEAIEALLIECSRDPDTANRIRELTNALLQKKLEQLETDNPRLAADIDRFRSESDLPDRYL